jgi:acyl transferase domain-containing protein
MDRSRISVILGVTSAQELLFSLVSRLQRPVWQKALRETGLPEDEVQAACERIAAHYVPWQEASFPGLLGNVVAGRIANRLGLGGTNCVTDAACASSFSAIQMAVNELQLGDSDLVIENGEFSASVDSSGRLQLKSFEVGVAPIDIPDEVFKKPAQLADVRVKLMAPTDGATVWTGC